MKRTSLGRTVSYLLVLTMIFGLVMAQGVATYAEGDMVEDEVSFARTFPETTNITRVFADQLPTVNYLTPEQLEFIATRFVGAQKLTLPTTLAIREIHPNFLMLHYHLAVWQSAVPYIIDGINWGNDYDEVTKHEDWFMHRFNPETGEVYKNEENRVYAFDDHKYLMNIMNEEYYQYLKDKLIRQSRAGEYDGVFLDSYHTAVLNWYLQNYPEYAGTSAAFGTYPEPGENMSWKEASEIFMARLTRDLNEAGLYSLPNLGNFNTGWDDTDYTISNGGMTESAFSYGNSFYDWQLGMNGHLKVINKDKINMCQEYLSDPWSYERRLYYLGNYLLLRGKYTYLYYFYDTTMSYYPEYELDLGAPLVSAGDNIDNLASNGLYIRDFEKGKAIVCPPGVNPVQYQVPDDAEYMKVSVRGTGEIAQDGTISGWIEFVPVSGSVTVNPRTSLILVKDPSINWACAPQFAAAFDFFKSNGMLQGEISNLIENLFRQAQHHLNKGSVQQAAKFMEKIARHLNNPEVEGYVADNAKYTLTAYADALARTWEAK